MPDPALPVPHARQLRHNFRRVFKDPLGRPMTGSVVLKLVDSQQHGSNVYLAVAASIKLEDGVAAGKLTPGTYELSATLRSPDGEAVAYTDRFEVD